MKSSIAFEDFDEAPPELWRLESKRKTPFSKKEISHVNWFATKEAADRHAAWIGDGRGRVVSLARYVRSEDEQPS